MGWNMMGMELDIAMSDPTAMSGTYTMSPNGFHDVGDMSGFFAEDRVGLGYNYGSKYWRSFTYGEDTLAGSKLATRGNAYEAYYSFPIVKKILTGEIRYTYMDYNYAGSDNFFGQTGNPDGMMDMMPYVESASDIRFSIRYRY